MRGSGLSISIIKKLICVQNVDIGNQRDIGNGIELLKLEDK